MAHQATWFTTRRELAHTNAAVAILGDLRRGIQERELKIGVRLPSEQDLARHYGVSRPVVREALRSAQALGLTETRTGSGTYVVSDTPLPQQSFGGYATQDLMEARPAIEVPSATLAAERRTAEQARELLSLCDRMDAESEAEAWVRLDSLFHASIAAASGNRVFASVVASMREALSQQSTVINIVAHRRGPSNSEHREIAEAISAGDAAAAGTAMHAHLGKVEAVMRPLLGAGE